MSATMTTPRFYESGSVARRLALSATRLHELGTEMGLPTERTDGGRRLWTEEEIAAIQRVREARRATRTDSRDAHAARG